MTKSLYGLPTEDLKDEAHVEFKDVGIISQEEFAKAKLDLEEGNSKEVTRMLDNLQWAKEFMNAYERKHKMGIK